MKRSIFTTSTGLSLLLGVGLFFNACKKDQVDPVNTAPAAVELEGAQRLSPISFLTWSALGTQFVVWKDGLRIGRISSLSNPFGIQVISDNATSIAVEGVKYIACTTTVQPGLLTFQKGATPGTWGPYYELTSTGLPSLRFRIKHGLTPTGTDAGGYFNANSGTSSWSTHSTTNTYFQWATNVILTNNCMNRN